MRAIMLVHWEALYTQPLDITIKAYFRASLTYWMPTCTFWLVGFTWASAFRLRRAVNILVPAGLNYGDGTVAP
eukprot:6770602-Pyramimonas_sp.AAC.1